MRLSAVLEARARHNPFALRRRAGPTFFNRSDAMIPLQLFDPASSTYTYLLHDPATREALNRILERRREFVIAASVSSGEEAVAYRGGVDVWLMDVRMIVRDEMDARLVELVLEGHSAEAMLQMIDLSDSGLKKRLGKLMRRAGVTTCPLLMAKLYAARAAM